MARIRTIKPELPQDVKLATASREARYTFVLLITQADDEGLIPGAHRQLLGLLYPHDEDVSTGMLLGWIEELVTVGAVRWRSTVDGAPILELTNWAKHQRVDNKGRSQLAGFLAPLAETRREPPRLAEDRGLDLGPGTKDLGPSAAPVAAAIRRTRPPRPSGQPDPLPKPICDAAYERYVKRIGAVEYPRFRKALLPVYRSAESDHPTADQLCGAIEAFAEAREAIEPKWRNGWTVEKLGADLHTYVRLGGMPLNDEWGEWTERGIAAGLASA